jgi:hypothetical protein
MIISNKIIFNMYKNEVLTNKNTTLIPFEKYQESLNLNNKGEQLKLGAFFIEIFCLEPTKIFERSYKNEKYLDSDNMELNDSDLAILILNDEYFNSLNNDVLIHPSSLPMITKPNI